jgi:hypothetical protein
LQPARASGSTGASLSREDHRGLENRPRQAGILHQAFGIAARAQVVAGPAAGVQRAHLQQPPDAVGLARGDEAARQVDIDAAKPVAAVARFIEDADEVDRHVAADQRGLERVGVVHVELAQFDAGRNEPIEVRAKVAAQQTNPMPVLGQSLDQRATDETGAAENSDTQGNHGLVLAMAGVTGQVKARRWRGSASKRPTRRSPSEAALPFRRQS